MTNDGDYFEADDVFVSRNEEGDVLPVEATAAGYGKCKVVPMTYGEAKETFGGEGDPVRQVEAKQVAEVITEHVVEPEISITEEDVEERMEPMAPQALLMAIMSASGLSGQVTVNDEGEASIDLQEGN